MNRDGKPAGIKEVAKYANVSVGTVSNVLNSPHKVSEATILRVQYAIEVLGYVRNNNASSLSTGTSGSIGLVVIDFANSFFVDIARGAQKGAIAAGLNLLVTNSDNDDNQQAAQLEYFNGARTRGILFAPKPDPAANLEAIRFVRQPIVMLNLDSEPREHCSVLVDNEHVGYLAARHLIELGKTRLAFVAGRDNLQPVHLRRIGVRRAVAEADGISLEEIDIPDLNSLGGTDAGIAISSRDPSDRPDAIIAVTDLIGMSIIQVLLDASISVPHDIAVVGCDYNSSAWGGSVSLTTVRLRGFEMGLEAMRLLVDEMSTAPGDHEHKTVVLEPSLLVRESTIGR